MSGSVAAELSGENLDDALFERVMATVDLAVELAIAADPDARRRQQPLLQLHDRRR